jgi:DNA mismatch repair protein MutL
LSIRVLPESVSSAIAAGEVIERPASVVKELVENSLDAGAGRIEIETEAAGVGRIVVSDDGSGINFDELELAVARFSTSKLQTTEDLSAIGTLGFRGEALASIGAVALLDITSRTAQAEEGGRVVAEFGSVGKVERCGSPVGTAVKVSQLFQNVPARRKFLKSEITEKRWIHTLVSRYVMAYPAVSFRLTQDGKVVLETSGNGQPREALAQVYGIETARALIELPRGDHPGNGMAVSGFVSPPAVSRGNRREISIYVNGRWVQDAGISAAVIQAYHTLLMVGRYPIVILSLVLAAETLDVNVHPTKAEVRFQDPGKIFSLVQRTVRATLIGQAPAPEAVTAWSSWKPEPGWALAGSFSQEPPAPRLIEFQAPLSPGEMPLLRAVGQVGAAYLVAEGPDGLYLIDQHAAHERILYDQAMEAHAAGTLASQGLLEPVTVELTPPQAELLEGQRDVLPSLGFDVEPFGGQTYRLRAVPAIVQAGEPGQALRSLVEDFEEDETPLAGTLEARLIARICKRSAVKAGQVLSMAEQQQLLRELEASTSPRTCPHGRPTLIHLSVANLEKQFGRR